MRLRKLLALTTAVVAIGATALTPTAQADPPTGGPAASVVVGGNTDNVDHPLGLTLKSFKYDINMYGFWTSLQCFSGSPAGVVKGGTSGHDGYEVNGLSITSMTLGCNSYYPGTTITWTATCPIAIDFTDSNVHKGTDPATDVIDTAVKGRLTTINDAGTGFCWKVTVTSGCTFDVGGAAMVTFDETARISGTQTVQRLSLSGNTLTSYNVSGCLGAFSNGNTFKITADFDVRSPEGLIDVQQPAVGKVLVGSSDADASHDLNGVLDSGSLNPKVYTIPTSLNCSSATASGQVDAGTTGLDPNPALTIDDLNLACGSIFPGTIATITSRCNVDVVVKDSNVHTGTVDTGSGPTDNAVDGVVNLTDRSTWQDGCLRYDISNGCHFTIGGYVAARFHEATGSVGGLTYQKLNLAGGKPHVVKPVGCLGAVKQGSPFPLNVTLKVRTPDGTINFTPDPAA